MNKSVAISVFGVVGSPLCVASGDGQKVHDRLAATLRQNRRVVLSFLNVSTLTSAFLNTAIGQLYGEFKENQIRELLSVEDMEAEDLALLKRVVDTAKLYFKDPERFNQAARETLDSEDDNGG
ncbi:MAG: STAS-like domain-containing protein [Deltaproteobacteria bacterium]|nr:STAS-like domain-containing protein [Deltaproteobacteria bacterium]